jgi:hypothetical protein
MTCWHFGLRRKFVPYLEGELRPEDVELVERHLLDCQMCRTVLLRLRTGHHIAQELRQYRPEAERPEFETVMAGAEGTSLGHGARTYGWKNWLDGLATPRAVEVLTLLVVVQSALLVFSNRAALFGARHGITVKPPALSWSEFHQLSIPELKSNTQPHIATEGFVREVHADEEEGTVHFKLVQNPQGSGPFVICEIMSSQMEVPREGSYVRVYGVARYDAQTDREWYEVNPVLNIAPVRH